MPRAVKLRNIPCSLCDRSFTNRAGLTNHERTHRLPPKNVPSRQQSPDAAPPNEPHFGGADEPVEDIPQPAATSKSSVEIHPLINGVCIELQLTYQI